MWAWLTHFDTKNMELEGDEDSEPVEVEGAAIASRVYAVSNLDFRYVDREKLHNFNLCSMELHTLLGICDVNIENVTNKGSLGHDDVDLEQTDDQESPSKRIRIDTGSDLTQILPVFLEKMNELSVKEESYEQDTNTCKSSDLVIKEIIF